MSDTKAQSHVCVLCNAKLGSKEALQEHFRKHANREIDGKGRPRKAKVPGGIVANGPKKAALPAPPQSVPRVNVPNTTASTEVPATTPGSSPSSSSCKTSTASTAPAAGATKSPGKPSSGIICDVCGQEFETVTIAIQHKFKKHPDSAIKHFCPHCGQQFPLKINRDKHLLVHPSAPPSQLFPCQECGVVFYNAQAQSYHFKSTHKRIVAIFKPVETPPPSKKIRMNNAGEAQSVYYCHICGYEYIIKFNLQKHIERHHPEEERNAIPEGIIKCTTCDALFYSKKAYDNHNMYHRPDDLYVTSEEQRLQTVSRVDQDFDIRRVQPGPEKFIPVNRPRPTRPISSLNKVDSKKSLRKLKGKKNNAQKMRRNAGRQPNDGSSDETEESDTSSESELSPDSGPDSDSDSDVPLKQCVKPKVEKPAASRGIGEAVKKKCLGGKRRGKAMSKFQAMAARKKAKLELTKRSSSSSSEGEGGGGGGVMGRARGGEGSGLPVERKRVVGERCDPSECSAESSSLDKRNARDNVESGKMEHKVVNGGNGCSNDAEMVTLKKEVCENDVEEQTVPCGKGEGKVGVSCEGQEAKGSPIGGQGSKERSCDGKGHLASEQIDQVVVKSEPIERGCLRSDSPNKEKFSSSVNKIPIKEEADKSS